MLTAHSYARCCDHTLERLQERYGLTITPAEYSQLCHTLRRQWPSVWHKPAHKGTRARIRVNYELHGQHVTFVYEFGTGLIITALELHAPRPVYYAPKPKKRRRKAEPYKRQKWRYTE